MSKTSDETISVRCRSCGVFYEQRENLLSGEWLWFANCKCPVTKDSAEVLTND